MKKFSIFLLTSIIVVLGCSCKLFDNVKSGETTETNYVNGSIDITFTKPDGWRFYSEEELADVEDMGFALLGEEDEELSGYIDFFAQSDDKKHSIGLAIDDLTKAGETFSTIEELQEEMGEECSNAFKKGVMKNLSGEEGFVSVVSDEWIEVQLAGKSYQMLKMRASAQIAPYYVTETVARQYVFIRKVDFHLVSIVATTSGYADSIFFMQMFTEEVSQSSK